MLNAVLPLLGSDQAAVRHAAVIAVRSLAVYDIRSDESSTEPGRTEGILTVIEALLSLASSTADNSHLSLTSSLAGWEALRDIGYKLQAMPAFTSAMATLNASTSEGIIELLMDSLEHSLRTEEEPLSRQEEEPLSRQEEALRVAQVETLSAFLFISTAVQPDKYVQLLNRVAANPQETTLVQAAAIASLERLGFHGTFGGSVQQQLREIAEDTAEPLPHRVSALEIASRIADYRTQQLPPITTPLSPLQLAVTPDPTVTNSIFYQSTPPPGTSFSTSMNLLSLLQSGLSSQIDIQQRAEIAFDQVYRRNFQQIYQAIAYLSGSGDPTLRKRTIEALGAVSYRQLPEPNAETEAEPPEAVIVRFLGHNLLCSRDAEIRRSAAYALGQLAPYWPNLLVQTRLKPYWYNSPADTIFEREDPGLDQLCTGSPDDEAGKQINVLSVLALSLNDSNERVIALSAYGLSRYGAALESRYQRSNSNAALTSSAPAQEPTNALVTELRVCMLALLSPTRLTIWPNGVDLAPRYQFLIEDFDDYSSQCAYELPDRGSDRSAIASAYVLGQVGISQSSGVEINEDDIKTVRYLLRVLQGRDLLAERALQPRFRRPSVAEQIALANRYREDDVRDSIVRYVLGRIHPRQQRLIDELIAAVEFPERGSAYPEQRERDCAYEANADNRDRICLQNSTTRAAVLGAVELIGISPQALETSNNSGSRLRRLLVQDALPTLAQLATTSVAESSNNTESSSSNDPKSSNDNESINEITADIQHVLAGSFDSINSCIGAAYALANTEIRDIYVINQLLNYLYIYPQPLVRENRSSEENRSYFGNLCIPQVTAPDATPSEPIVPLLEQLTLLRTGAIAALGQIKPLASANGLPQPHAELPRVVRCLVDIANGERFLPLLIDDINIQPNEYESCPILRQGDVNRLPETVHGQSDQATETFQAVRWGLEPREYQQMKRAMQNPAIEAIGELAIAEAPEQYDALCALAFDSLGTLSQKCGDSPRIRDVWVGNIANPAQRADFIQRRSLKLQYIEATAQKLYADLQQDISDAKLQPSDLENDPRQQKLNIIIHEFLAPMLNPPLDPEEANNSTNYSVTSLSRFESAREFRNQVLTVLTNLEPQAFSTLELSARRNIIRNLGFTSGSGVYGECLSPEANLLTQERLCFGAIHLLTSTWSPNFNSRIGEFANVSRFLRELIQLPTNAPTARTSPLIQASAIQAMGFLGIYDRNQDTAILFDQLNGTDSRVVAATVDAFASYTPSLVMPSIRQQLNSNNEQVALQAIELIWQLGQINESSWPGALQQSEIVNDLVNIASQTTISALLRSRTIYILGELRITDRRVVTLLTSILTSGVQGQFDDGLEIQEAAAYALGRLGQSNPEIGREALPLLYNLIVSVDERTVLAKAPVFVAASYAIAQIGLDESVLSDSINRHAVTTQLIELYNRLLSASSNTNNSESASHLNDLAALALYVIGQRQSPEINVANLYGASLRENLPVNVRAVAASYASSIPVWNSLLVTQLANATQDSNVALRLSAILSLSGISERNIQNIQTQDLEIIKNALSSVFWQENEYAELRLAAGNGLCRLLQPSAWSVEGDEKCLIEQLTPDLFTDAFRNSLENLQALQDASGNSNAPYALTGFGSAEGLVSLRSARLIADLDQNLSTIILLSTLDDRVSNSASNAAVRDINSRRGQSRGCRFRLIRRILQCS
ncbi:hypothetical protein [Leptolyngbya sp. PCC 6406]|uniref:hypothetical protein n=1 Tax=Leptolyngbya sp. PCC 6406 TaxID=1173264 RepID=UPI0012DCDB4A|nr:hypothetical protein [Leptolyngbya sp. PCC 6406]